MENTEKDLKEKEKQLARGGTLAQEKYIRTKTTFYIMLKFPELVKEKIRLK